MNGYLNSPEETITSFWNVEKRHEDGWLRSGDIGVMDEQGYVAIVDRLKDLIITGGENVFPGRSKKPFTPSRRCRNAR